MVNLCAKSLTALTNRMSAFFSLGQLSNIRITRQVSDPDHSSGLLRGHRLKAVAAAAGARDMCQCPEDRLLVF